jgi:hypothetical protein
LKSFPQILVLSTAPYRACSWVSSGMDFFRKTVRDPTVLKRMEVTFDLCETAEVIMRQNLQRRHPELGIETDVRRMGLRWALIGGLAVSARAEPRTTRARSATFWHSKCWRHGPKIWRTSIRSWRWPQR